MKKIIIPVCPRGKKNSQQIVYNSATKRRTIIQSKLYLQYEKECKKYLQNCFTINNPINLKCIFFVPDKRRRDLVNYIEAIQDILVKYKVIEDDNYNIVQSIDGSKMYIDKENPRVEIEITEMKEEKNGNNL